jgi:hypothetical protein
MYCCGSERRTGGALVRLDAARAISMSAGFKGEPRKGLWPRVGGSSPWPAGPLPPSVGVVSLLLRW